MNVNLLSNSSTANAYTDSLLSNGFTILSKIDDKFATRVANRTINQQSVTSRTIIDHAATNCVSYAFTQSLFDTHISDHRLMAIAFNDCKQSNFINMVNVVSHTIIDERNFHAELVNLFADPSYVDQITLPQFIEQINVIKHENTITKTYNRRANPTKKWVTHEFLCLIGERKRNYLLKMKSPTNVYLNEKYREICERLKILRISLRTSYNAKIVNQCANDPKKM